MSLVYNITLLKYTRFVLGDSSKISFWHDVWCEDQFLNVAFSEFFFFFFFFFFFKSIAFSRDATVADHLQLSNGSHWWNVIL
jgi:hypothetical protein